MKRGATIFFGVVLLVTGLCFWAGAQDAKKPLYTAYNIWRNTSKNMYCINFKSSDDFIPAGSRVIDTRIVKKPIDPRARASPHVHYIKFTVADTNEDVSIKFRKRWHPGKKVEDYFKYMFTHKPFDELTNGLSGTEIEAIKQGKVVQGMWKKAVLISFGYPPEHKTASLGNQQWVYWMTTMRKKSICFDEYDRAISCEMRKTL
jgi:hypothetical protein